MDLWQTHIRYCQVPEIAILVIYVYSCSDITTRTDFCKIKNLSLKLFILNSKIFKILYVKAQKLNNNNSISSRKRHAISLFRKKKHFLLFLQRILKDQEDLPAGQVKPTNGEVYWILDEEAAKEMK